MAQADAASHHDDHGHHHHHGHDHHHHDHDHPRHHDLDAMKHVECCEIHNTSSNAEGAIILALLGGAMVLSTFVAKYLGIDDEIRQIPAVVGALILWVPLFRGAWREMQRGRPSTSFLVTIAISAALATGEYVTAGALAFILFMMDAILRRTAWGAHKAIEQLVHLTPDTARVVVDGEERIVPLEEVRIGTVIRVRPGENFPADGTVVTGRTSINQASLTGESAPVEVETGDPVYAGTTNLTGSIEAEVTRLGIDTTIGKVVTLINEAELSKTPRQQIIEIVAGHYVWIVLMIALAVFILSPDKTGGAEGVSATEKAIAVLVVTCPGALLLASPTAMVAAFASAARLGIMIKNTSTLEAAASVDTVVLDKTGTITTGKFAVSRLAPAEGVEGADLLAAAAAAERHSNHPLALAIMETAKAARIEVANDGHAEEVHGLGVKVQRPDGELYAGRAKWLLEMNPGARADVEAVENKIGGMTGVHVMKGGRYLGAVGLEDRVRPKAAEAIAELRQLGVRQVHMFTGDRAPVANRVAQVVGIDRIEAECHPDEKHAAIVELTRNGRHVMMVGDGINDGPSLAASDVGVAMGLGGTDIAANSAGVALMNDELSRLPFLVELARKTRGVITQNIIASIIIALVGLAFAASGQLGEFTVFLAAVWHGLADVFVIGNSFRLVRYGEEHGVALPGDRTDTTVLPDRAAAPAPAV
ncbi:MAG: heavy metal translocating P-type ATPase [Phycisphaerales bacterium]